MKNLLTTLSIIIISTLLFISCKSLDIASSVNSAKSKALYNSNTNLFPCIGSIEKFDSNKIYIKFGTYVEFFEIDKSQINDYYVGEYVCVMSSNDGIKIEKYQKDNFDKKIYPFGNEIKTIRGNVNKIIDSSSFSVISNNENFIFNSSNCNDISLNSNLSIEYISTSKGNLNAVNIYNEDLELKLFIDSIERNDIGEMILNTKTNIENEHIDYIISITAETNIELNLSILKQNSKIKIIPFKNSAEKNDNKLIAKRISLIN